MFILNTATVAQIKPCSSQVIVYIYYHITCVNVPLWKTAYLKLRFIPLLIKTNYFWKYSNISDFPRNVVCMFFESFQSNRDQTTNLTLFSLNGEEKNYKLTNQNQEKNDQANKIPAKTALDSANMNVFSKFLITPHFTFRCNNSFSLNPLKLIRSVFNNTYDLNVLH